ncbi:alpha/beta hydrolase [Rubripirellula reticaptiva]|uniref:Carboxylesterase NlhH n=1 Tax=Rubripirellula reticaptiva TaxID=2528013 RepID=A0A5C6EG60_9BACT|nr:alpha/beta hydrolase [Rubripirellula reticaptiva]TWU47818.1 Carboxylesterase NlhH [Rubripirellula reticaptiva]
MASVKSLACTFAVSVCVCIAFAGSVSAEEAAPTEHTLNYKTVSVKGKDVELKIDWTRPADWKATDSRPAVVFFHGGGWTGGAPGQFAEHSIELAKLGMVCFRGQYRLLDKKNKDAPDICVEDASDAFEYVRSHASEFGIDPERIAAGGGSAGGHLAAYLGMMDDTKSDVSRKPAALLLFNPVYDNGPGGWGTARVGDQYAKYSPAHNITADDPPSIVFLGTNDKLIPVATAEKFRDDCKRVGVNSELHLYEKQPHGFFNAKKGGKDEYYRDTLAKSVNFLTELGWVQP